jgi:hypothetical protein
MTTHMVISRIFDRLIIVDRYLLDDKFMEEYPNMLAHSPAAPRWHDHAASVIEGRTSVRTRVILSIMFPNMANGSIV